VRYDSCQLSGRHVHQPDGDGDDGGGNEGGNGGGARTTVRYDMCLLANHGQRDFIEGVVDRVRFVDCLDR